jgi:hypothetical protein
VLVLSRDIGIVATVAIVNLAIGRRTFRPSFFGKLATATFLVTGVATLAVNALGVGTWIVPLLADVCLALTVISGLHYALFASRLTSEP